LSSHHNAGAGKDNVSLQSGDWRNAYRLSAEDKARQEFPKQRKFQVPGATLHVTSHPIENGMLSRLGNGFCMTRVVQKLVPNKMCTLWWRGGVPSPVTWN
jgi:hypothetical protein